MQDQLMRARISGMNEALKGEWNTKGDEWMNKGGVMMVSP